MRSFTGSLFWLASLASAWSVFVPAPSFASLYARTNKPLVIFNKRLPAGSYIEVEYDGGDTWVLPYRKQHIAKPDATLVPLFNIKPEITAKLNKPSPVYKNVPLLYIDSSSLEQRDPDSPPMLAAGTKIRIWQHEGDDYLIAYQNDAYKSRSNLDGIALGRMPVSAVEIDPGQTFKEIEEKLPPDPAIATAAQAAHDEQIRQAQYQAALAKYQATLTLPKKIGDYVCDQTGHRLGYVENIVEDRVQIRTHGFNVGVNGVRQDYDQIIWGQANAVGRCDP